MSTWMRLRCGRGASICWNQNEGPAASRVDDVLLGVAPELVAERCPPEGHHLRDRQCVDRNLDVLHPRRVGRDAQLSRGRGDLPSNLDLPRAVPAEEVPRGDRGQPYGHALVAEVDFGLMVLVDVRQLSDRLHETGTRRERIRAEERVDAVTQKPPVLDARRRP